MADLSVPSNVRSQLIPLASLSPEGVSELRALLKDHPNVLTSRQSAFEAASSLKQLGVDDGFSLLEAVIPLMYLKASANQTTESIVNQVVDTLGTGAKGEAKLPPSMAVQFRKNLTTLLDVSEAALKAKALSLATDGQRVFSTVRILTDIRPIFGDDASQAPVAAVVLHNLRINFAENGKEREFFVQLDSSDLQDLQESIERARTKEETVTKFLLKSKLQLIDTFE